MAIKLHAVLCLVILVYFPAVTNFHTIVFESNWSVIVTVTSEDLLLLGRDKLFSQRLRLQT